ncbi:MAG: metalloregulator ArsR/SmtB family transcription factor [Streptosporangiaceae bacterium]
MTTQADDELWSAIADPSRRRVLDLLVSNGAVSASWLAGRVPFSRQAVSKHLVVLEEAGLVSRRKRGNRARGEQGKPGARREEGEEPS